MVQISSFSISPCPVRWQHHQCPHEKTGWLIRDTRAALIKPNQPIEHRALKHVSFVISVPCHLLSVHAPPFPALLFLQVEDKLWPMASDACGNTAELCVLSEL